MRSRALALVVAAALGACAEEPGPAAPTDGCNLPRTIPAEALVCERRADCRLDSPFVDCHNGCWGYERGHVVAVRADHDWGVEAPCMCGVICFGPPPDPTLLAGC